MRAPPPGSAAPPSGRGPEGFHTFCNHHTEVKLPHGTNGLHHRLRAQSASAGCGKTRCLLVSLPPLHSSHHKGSGPYHKGHAGHTRPWAPAVPPPAEPHGGTSQQTPAGCRPRCRPRCRRRRRRTHRPRRSRREAQALFIPQPLSAQPLAALPPSSLSRPRPPSALSHGGTMLKHLHPRL